MPSSVDEYDNPVYWLRLGDLLRQRRVQLGYRTFQAFADAVSEDEGRTGFYRLAWDAEHGGGNRLNGFPAGTIARLEDGYQWERGSFTRTLRGGDPKPTSTISWEGAPGDVWENHHDEMVIKIWTARSSYLDQAGKIKVIRHYLSLRNPPADEAQKRA